MLITPAQFEKDGVITDSCAILFLAGIVTLEAHLIAPKLSSGNFDQSLRLLLTGLNKGGNNAQSELALILFREAYGNGQTLRG